MATTSTVQAAGAFKLGKWHDVGWWELTLKPATEEPPRPPLKLVEIQSSPSWQEMLDSGLSCIHQSEQL